jgi:hypothetical protein
LVANEIVWKRWFRNFASEQAKIKMERRMKIQVAALCTVAKSLTTQTFAIPIEINYF